MCVRVETTSGLSEQFKPAVSCGSVATLFLTYGDIGLGPFRRGSGGEGLSSSHCTALHCSTGGVPQRTKPFTKAYCPTTGRFLQYLLGGTATKQSQVPRNVQ